VCSAVSRPYRKGISHPAKSVRLAPSFSWTPVSGVRRGGLAAAGGESVTTLEPTRPPPDVAGLSALRSVGDP